MCNPTQLLIHIIIINAMLRGTFDPTALIPRKVMIMIGCLDSVEHVRFTARKQLKYRCTEGTNLKV